MTNTYQLPIFKFKLNQKVLMKSYCGTKFYCDKECTVIGTKWHGDYGCAKIEYQVSIPTPYWHDEQFFGFHTYMGQKNVIVTVNESDLSAINSHFDVDTATGTDLDKIASDYGLKRNHCEPDSNLRVQIKEFTEGANNLNPAPICECGSDKHGFANHSNWCPKHK